MNPLTEAWLAHRAEIRATRTRLGMEGYLHLAAMLRDKPMTAVQLTSASGMGHVAAYRFLSTMHKARRVHIAGWHRKPHTPARPIFAWGDGSDAPAPTRTASNRACDGVRALPDHRMPPLLVRFCMLLSAIEHCASRQEVIEATGIDTTVVGRSLDLAVRLGLAHIAVWQWRPQGGAPVPQFLLGAGVNAARPSATAVKRAARQLRNERARASRPFVPLATAVAAWGAAA